MRGAIVQAMANSGKDMKRDGGVSILGQSDQEAANNLLSQLAEYGIFIVPGGELESWVKNLNVSGHGPSWLIDVFEKMGDDPDNASYVRPTAGDVWVFMSRVRSWLLDSNRKGIPE
ncbi:MAG: hypothetical protein ABSF96_00775 [Steroidobacteraceae bacterium]|jgi:hypothetical protein